MTGYVASLLLGLAVGVAYGLVQVRSPAPPLIALVGLLGMVLGEQAIEMVKHHFPLTPRSGRLTGGPRTSLASLPARAAHERGYRPKPAFLPKRGGLVVVVAELWLSEVTVKIHRGH
jgi:XapX domain-containing protein